MTVQKVYEFDDHGAVVTTPTGVRCGNHGHDWKDVGTYHADADSVRECYRIDRARQAEADAEAYAEGALLRYLEDRGYDDARAQEDHENRHGVIQFSDAWDMAGR